MQAKAGIADHIGATTVTASTISSNTAARGGISNITGTIAVDASTVSSNTATSGTGGGICNLGGTTTVSGSRILSNTATTNGGGVYNNYNAAAATDVTGSCPVGNSASSFFNNPAAQQSATGNWWGVATGPNTSCGDTTGGNVDTGGFLTAPILGCPTLCAPPGDKTYLPLIFKS